MKHTSLLLLLALPVSGQVPGRIDPMAVYAAPPAVRAVGGLPATIQLDPGIPVELTLDVAADDVAVAAGGPFVAVRSYTKNPKQVVLFLMGFKEGGPWALTIYTAAVGDDKTATISKAVSRVTVGNPTPPAPPPGPAPGPPPGPGPGPQPPPAPEPDPNPVDPADPDAPPAVADATAVQAIRATGVAKADLYKLSRAHAAIAAALSGKANLQANLVAVSAQQQIRAAGVPVTAALQRVLGDRLNAALPVDPAQVMTAADLRSVRKAMLSVARDLYAASR